jgi:hypothetical protein
MRSATARNAAGTSDTATSEHSQLQGRQKQHGDQNTAGRQAKADNRDYRTSETEG